MDKMRMMDNVTSKDSCGPAVFYIKNCQYYYTETYHINFNDTLHRLSLKVYAIRFCAIVLANFWMCKQMEIKLETQRDKERHKETEREKVLIYLELFLKESLT